MLKNLDLIKQLLQFELRSILRSKYLRYALIHNYTLIPLAFFVLKSNEKSSEALVVLWTCLLLAVPVIGISGFSFSKDGLFYQALMTRNISVRVYVQGKVLFIIIYAVVFYLCILPFILRCSSLVLHSFMAGSIYYIGFGGMIMLYYSSFDKHKIDLSRSPFFNYEGFSFVKVILSFPLISPLLFWDKTRYLGIAIMFLLGIAGFFMFNFFVNLISKNLSKRKYTYISLASE